MRLPPGQKSSTCIAGALLLSLILGPWITAVETTTRPALVAIAAERLAEAGAWNAHQCRFAPAAGGRAATVEFTPDQWGALIATRPIDRRLRDVRFAFSVRCRWTGKPGRGGMEILFQGKDGVELKTATVGGGVPQDAEWHDLRLEGAMPPTAEGIRLDLSCMGGGILEIADYRLEMLGADLTAAAVAGAELPWLSIPGGAAARIAQGPEGAESAATGEDPFAFDSPVWKTLPAYPIRTTTCNKTPPGEVAASFRTAWTADHLVVRFAAHDPVLNFTDESRYLRDCFEFFLTVAGGKEQYTVSRTAEGETSANTEAITRTVADGWEAIIRIPLRNEARRIQPFNGLGMTCNAAYQDANTVGQEHWLSFSAKDQVNGSWNDTSLYAPFVFTAVAPTAYRPLWLGDRAEYDVEPAFAGRINLVRNEANVDNLAIWEYTDALLDAYRDGDHPCFRIRFPADAQHRIGIVTTPFAVLPGETLEMEYEARCDAGPEIPAPNAVFIARSCWLMDGFRDLRGIGPQWTRQHGTVKLSDAYRDNKRTGRMLMFIDCVPGRTIELRDLRITHRVPTDLDAVITTPTYYSHGWSGEAQSAAFSFAAGQALPRARVEARAIDYLTGAVALEASWVRDLPAGGSALDWDIAGLPNGMFDIQLKVRDAQGGFLVQRELYVTRGTKADAVSAFSGVFVGSNNDPPAPRNAADIAAGLRGMGIGMSYWGQLFPYDSRGREHAMDPLRLMRELKLAGIGIGTELHLDGPYHLTRRWEPDELRDYYQRTLGLCRGWVDYVNFANEPNLYMDARDWSVYYRAFANAVKRSAPGTATVMGCLNAIPVDYWRAASAQNRRSFADGVLAIHAYGLEVDNEACFRETLAKRVQTEALYPGWREWDTESGLVFYSFRGILDLQSKKAPILLCTGVERSYAYNGLEMIVPCGDSSPILPMESYKNRFYLGAKPVGRVLLADGKVHAYLFAGADGRGRAALWNTAATNGSATAALPIAADGRHHDLFGNDRGALPAGEAALKLDDGFVHYVDGLDLAKLRALPTFTAAFALKQDTPATDVGYLNDTYIALPSLTRAFDREVQVGQPSAFALRVCNDGATPRRVRLSSTAPAGLRIAFSATEVALAPQEAKTVQVELRADAEVAPQDFTLAGATDDGAKLVPLVFTVRTTPPICAAGFTRTIEIRNSSPAPAAVEVVATKPVTALFPQAVFFKPATITAQLAPGATLQAALTAVFDPPQAPESLNVPFAYQVRVKGPQGTYTTEGSLIHFAPLRDDGAPIDFARLPFSAVPEVPGNEPFRADYRIGWSAAGLRLSVRVQDASPRQDGNGSGLKDGGDCLLAAFDLPVEGQEHGAYLECGFAAGAQGPTSYAWEGKYGLETALPFPDAVGRISRDPSSITYDVVIPAARIAPPGAAATAGMSLAILNRGADGTTQRITLGQGILPRDPARMGLLLRPAR